MSWQELVFGVEPQITQAIEVQQFEEEVPEEEPLWYVVTALDELVCPVCSPLEGETFPESALDETFPEAMEAADGVLQLNIHAPRDYKCRCQAFRVDEGETQLSEEDFSPQALQFGSWEGGIF